MTTDQRQRFEGVLSFLTEHTEQIRAKLADAFIVPGVPGGIRPLKAPRFETFWRGTLESVTKRQAAILGSEIPISFDSRFGSREPFVDMSTTDLESIILNLIVNSIDACKQNTTHGVKLHVYPSREFVHVQVIDDGSGMSLAEQPRIFEPGFGTKGTERGHGLATCLAVASAAGAKLMLIDSRLGKGTTMELQVRERPTPKWFVDEIELAGASVIVVVDDEGHVGEFWEERISHRLDGIGLPAQLQPILIGLTHPSQLRGNDQGALGRGSLFLIDYKFDNDSTTGIQLIEELHLQASAILVTNLFDDPDVVNAVNRLDIRLMPKKYRFSIKFPIHIGVDHALSVDR
jgi:hypothetical protein